MIYLEKPNAASFHWYFSSAAAPASGNMALTFYNQKDFTSQFFEIILEQIRR